MINYVAFRGTVILNICVVNRRFNCLFITDTNIIKDSITFIELWY